MTPSGWHDDAQSRDAGHDEMQAGVYRFMQSRGAKTLEKTERDKILIYERRGVYFECPIYHDGRISTFIDVCVHFAKSDEDKQYLGHKNILFCYEIKPKIYSVGATIRQCHAMDDTIRRGSFYKYAGPRGYTETPEVHIIPVVLYNDPKLELLGEFWPEVVTWNATIEICEWYVGPP